MAARLDRDEASGQDGPDPGAWRRLLAARAAADAGASPDFPRTDCQSGDDPGGLLALLRELALAPRARGWALAVLGQSLDGHVATAAGDSLGLNGAAALAHLHRLRALSDAVLVGVETAVLDRPRLTTRRCEGPNPVRVVVDPRGRLPASCPLLHDGAAPTLVLRAGPGPEPREERVTEWARVLTLPAEGPELPPARLLAALRARGLTRVMVEGGGITVSRFLRHGALDHLHLLVAPLLTGPGRPGLALASAEPLAAAWRPPSRRYLLGEDVLFAFRLDRPAPPAG